MYQQQPVLGPYIHMVDNQFGYSLDNAMRVTGLLDPTYTRVYNEVRSYGYDLVTEVLTWIVGTTGWSDNNCNSVIDSVIQYVIYQEALKLGKTIYQFEPSASWVISVQPQVETYINMLLQQKNAGQYQPPNQGYIDPRTGYQYQPLNQGYIGRNSVTPPQFNNTHISQGLGSGSVLKDVTPINTVFTGKAPAHVPEQETLAIFEEADTPPIPPHKVPLESIIILDRRADTPNARYINQLGTILELTETITQPTLITFYKEIVLPVANEYNSDIIHDMDLFTATDTMLELRDVLTSVSEKDGLGRFTTLITSMIEAAVVEALIHRYNVPAMIRFPYLTHPKKCNELLFQYGIKNEIEAIALDVIRPMSPSCVYTSIGLLDDVLTTHNDIIEIDEAADMLQSNRVVLTASMPSPVLVLPDDYTYDYLNEELLSKNEKANNEISALFQVAFQMVDPTVVSIEIYDASLRKFKVTQLGIPSDLNAFKVVPK